MSHALRRYIAFEAAVSAVINGALSLAFCLLLFGGEARVPVAGIHGLMVDAVPQGVMIALMSAIVPTLLTWRRLRRGVLPGGADRVEPSGNALRQALLIAAIAAPASVMANAALLSIGPPDWPFMTVAIVKTLYGAMLGAITASVAIRAALMAADR
jgi:hypothetical protein